MNPQAMWEVLERADGLALNAGVQDDTQFTQLHGITGLELPTSVQAAYLRHNGQASGGQPLFISQYRWLSLGEVVREWREWQALMEDESMAEMRNAHESCGSEDHPVRLDWWNAHWLPLARNDFGDLLCIDGQPIRSGAAGQIIEVFHDQESREVVADSFVQLLGDVVADGLCKPGPDAVIKGASERAIHEHDAVRNRETLEREAAIRETQCALEMAKREALERESKLRATQHAFEMANRRLISIHANALAHASVGAWEDVERQLSASWRELALAPWANEQGWRARSQILLQVCSLCASDKSWLVLIRLVRAGKDAVDRCPADLACRAALARMYGVAIVHFRQDEQREFALQMQAGLSALAQRFADDGAVQKILAETSMLG